MMDERAEQPHEVSTNVEPGPTDPPNPGAELPTEAERNLEREADEAVREGGEGGDGGAAYDGGEIPRVDEGAVDPTADENTVDENTVDDPDVA